MQVIEHIELASAQSSIEFTSIPDTYTDLYLVISARSNVTFNGNYLGLRFNGSSSGYSNRQLQGYGSGVVSGTIAGTIILAAFIAEGNYTANTFSSSATYIPNYTSSIGKSTSSDGVSENNATEARQTINAGFWSGTAAISSITIVTESGNFVSGSSATLYGILAGSDGTTTVS